MLASTALLGACNPRPAPAAEPVRVAAAADLSFAFEELGKLFEARTGQKVALAFGASGVLAAQLGQGAPFDLFAAANVSFVEDAVRRGACDGSTTASYARGHLVVWTPPGTPRIASLGDLLGARFRRIAIANPEHAPYGKAAREALIHSGLWSALSPKVVQADNVRQALQFAQTGNADAAIVARSLVAGNTVPGETLDVDPALHAPLEQALVVCQNGKNAEGARAFARLVKSEEGQQVLQRYGFGTSGAQIRQ